MSGLGCPSRRTISLSPLSPRRLHLQLRGLFFLAGRREPCALLSGASAGSEASAFSHLPVGRAFTRLTKWIETKEKLLLSILFLFYTQNMVFLLFMWKPAREKTKQKQKAVCYLLHIKKKVPFVPSLFQMSWDSTKHLHVFGGEKNNLLRDATTAVTTTSIYYLVMRLSPIAFKCDYLSVL